MNLMWRALFVVVSIVVGSTAVHYFVLGNSTDYAVQNTRIGAWREAQVRPACYAALERPERAHGSPKRPAMQNRISLQDYNRTVELTAALRCYLVTQQHAVCERNNRAYIVDYIRRYFDKMDAMLATAASYGADEVRNVRDLWNSPNNRDTIAALDDHIRNGRLIKADFGWTVPSQIKPQLERAGKADACANAPPWVAVKV